MTFRLRFTALSDVGRVRRDNQDSGYAGPHLLLIADGVGGAARGDIASSAAVEAIRKLDVPPGNDPLSELAATIHLAHDRLAEIVEGHPDLDGTSTTVSAAVFDGTQLAIGHVGDSRGYLLRDGVLRQLTDDHTLVQSLVDEGRITEDEARVHPHRNLILRAVDGVHEPEPDLFTTEVNAGDRLLFCSDGCSGVLTNHALAALLAIDPLETATSRLVSAALDAGSSDNVTVVVAEVLEDDDEASPPAFVVGAAASAPHLRISDESTGNLSDTEFAALSEEGLPLDPEDLRYAPQPPRRGSALRILAVVAVVVALLGGAGWGAYAYSQTRYYVSDNSGKVAIFKGVDLDIWGAPPLHHLVKSTDIPLSAIEPYFATEVRNGKAVESLAKAEKYVAGLPLKCADTSTIPVPSTPVPTPTPLKAPTRTATPTRTPTPTPTPTPITLPSPSTTPGTGTSGCTGAK
ncbi:MAG: serine/threonine-protein phosphatase [Marmoricola sp.]|nr:serine/threonine-protein phosphatase [Marmoricola sp.]